jgi:hypothetical protein
MNHAATIGDLKSCPFCAAPARTLFEGSEPDMIWCGGNGCRIRPMLWFCDFGSPEEAVAAWNRRAA